MIKNRNFESKFNKNLIEKHQNPIKPKNIAKINMMASGGVNELGGINKKIFEKFFGVALPKIKIHKTTESIGKASHYHAYSYAQGNNIYLGKDVKPIDTVEGQTVIAHEITHVLQQKYLDMSSNKEMVDPSVELERKAKVVEDRVRVTKGIDRSSGDYFRKWDVLPERSYQNRVASVGKFSESRVVQRIVETKPNEKNFYLHKKEIKFDEGRDSLTTKVFSSENKAESTLKWGVFDKNNNPKEKFYKGRKPYENKLIPTIEASASTHNTVVEVDYKNSLWNDDISESSFQSVSSMHSVDAKAGINLSSKGVGGELGAEYAMYKEKIEGEYALNIPFLPKYQIAVKGGLEGKALAVGANASGNIGKHDGGWGVSGKLGLSALFGLGANVGLEVKEDKDFLKSKKENQVFIKNITSKYNQTDNMRLMRDASYAYKPNEFYKRKLKYSKNPNLSPLSQDEIDLRTHSNEPKNIDESKNENPELRVGEKTVLSKVDSETGLETFMTQKMDEKYQLSYKLVFRGTWPFKFNEALKKHDDSIDFSDVIEDGYFRGTRQSEKAKKIYQGYFSNISNTLISRYKLPIMEIAFTGHSLGGYLANSVMTDFIGNRMSYGNISPKSVYAETYNALGLTVDEFYAYEKQKKDPKNKGMKIESLNHRTEYDPVSRFGVQPGAMITHELKDSSAPLWEKILNAHSMENFTLHSNNYKDKVKITKDRPNIADKYLIDNNYIRSAGVTTLATIGAIGYGGYKGAKWVKNTAIDIKDGAVDLASRAYDYGVKKAIQFKNFAVDTKDTIVDGAIDIKNKVVNTAGNAYDYGVKKATQFKNFAVDTKDTIVDGAIDIKNKVVNTAGNAYDYGVKKATQFKNFAVDTKDTIVDGAIGIKNNVVKTVSNASDYGVKKVEEASKYVSNKAQKIGDSISTGANNAYKFSEQKVQQFGNTVSDGWNSFKSLFAETNRHQNYGNSNAINSHKEVETVNTVEVLDNSLDEISMKIFRKLKSEIALEYARKGM